MQPPNLPEDVLIIHYATLSPKSSARLQVLAAVGQLLKSSQSQPLENLLADAQARNALQTWLSGEDAGKFWQIINGKVVPLRACEKHLLVGTRQLMDDLSTLRDKSSSPKLADLNAIWQAADIFVSHNLKRDGVEA